MTPAPRRTSWTWLWILVGGALFTQTALNVIRPVTTYKLLSLGADPTILGVVTAAYALVPLITALWFGRISDRIPDLRWLVASGAWLLALGGAGLAMASNIPLVAVASAVLGLGHLVFTIAGQTAVARYSPPGRLNTGFGWFTAAYSAGQLVGPLIGGTLLGTEIGVDAADREENIAAALWAGAALSAIAAPLMLLRRRLGSRYTNSGSKSGSAEERSPEEVPTEQKFLNPDGSVTPATLTGVLKVRGVPSHMLASLALLAMLDILTAFLPLVGERAGISPAEVGLMLAIRAMASILSRVLIPWLSTLLSSRALLLISLYGSGLALIFPPLFIDQFWLAASLLVLGGFCLGLGQPLTMTLVSMSVPPAWRGAALAVRLTGNRAGQVVMPLAAGFIAAPLGAAGAIWFTCAVLLLSGWQKTVRQ